MDYEQKTIGRWGPRAEPTRTGKQHEPMFMFFDGKSFTPVNNRGVDPYTNYGITGLALRPTKFQYTDQDYVRAYALCEYAFRCIEMVASDIAAIKHGVRDKHTKKPIPDHPLVKALAWSRINLFQDVLSLWQKARYVFGETYLFPVPNGFTSTNGRNFYGGLQWLNPLVVEPVILGSRLTGFDYYGGTSIRFDRDAIIFDKVSSLLDDLRGQSPLSVALQAVNIDVEIKRYTLDSFLKDMRMSGILTGRAGSGITENELKAAVSMLKDQRESRLIALAAPLEYQQVQHKFTDAPFQASDDARRRITTALGVPMSVVGAWDDAHYQSAPAQIEFYYDHVIFRECDRLELFIDEVILPYFDPSGSAEWYFDRDSVRALRKNENERIATYNARLNAGGMTLNEYRQALGENPVPNGDVYYIPSGVVITPASQIGASIPAPAIAAAIPAAVPAPDVNPAPITPDLKAVGDSACLMLKIGAHPDLIQLQQRVRSLCESKGIEVAAWNDPDEFHITLAYAPAASDEQIETLRSLLDDLTWDEDMHLKIGRLQAFNNVGEYPIVFRVSKTADLAELQESCFELFEAAQIAVSGHHQPAQYIPHITMGYASASIGKPILYQGSTRIAPQSIELWHGETLIYQRAFNEPEPPPIDPSDEQNSTRIENQSDGMFDFTSAALDELAAWRKKVKNVGPYKAESFKVYLIREDIATYIIEALSTDDDQIIAQAFKTAREQISIKSIQGTRLLFEDAFTDLLTKGLEGTVTRRQWTGRLRSLLELNIYRAYLDGLKDGGIDDDPTEDDTATINKLIKEQGQYISGLADALFKDEDTVISEAAAEQKPAMWFNKSVYPAYQAGLAAADANGLYEWVYGDREHCDDCRKLNGQRHRLKDYHRKGILPKSSDLKCKGFNCGCNLVRTGGKARGNWI